MLHLFDELITIPPGIAFGTGINDNASIINDVASLISNHKAAILLTNEVRNMDETARTLGEGRFAILLMPRECLVSSCTAHTSF
jgi:hypothetical protein